MSASIGVILGGASGALATIDIDLDEFLPAFLEANPRLRGSLNCQLFAVDDVVVAVERKEGRA